MVFAMDPLSRPQPFLSLGQTWKIRPSTNSKRRDCAPCAILLYSRTGVETRPMSLEGIMKPMQKASSISCVPTTERGEASTTGSPRTRDFRTGRRTCLSSTAYYPKRTCTSSTTKAVLHSPSMTLNSMLRNGGLEASALERRMLRYAASITGSNAYWHARQQEIQSTFATKGSATVFTTLSAADNHCKDLRRLMPPRYPDTGVDRRRAVIGNPHIVD